MLLAYRPQLPTLVAVPPAGEAWLHELKHDGYRMGIVLEAGSARIESRRGLDWSSSLGELSAAAQKLPARDLVLDGEACVLKPDGRASFQLMQNAVRGAAAVRPARSSTSRSTCCMSTARTSCG